MRYGSANWGPLSSVAAFQLQTTGPGALPAATERPLAARAKGALNFALLRQLSIGMISLSNSVCAAPRGKINKPLRLPDSPVFTFPTRASFLADVRN